MRVALLVRDSATARALAVRVAERWDLAVIVAESGRPARRRKLKRELKRGFPWRLPLTLLDFAALATYDRLWSAFLARRGVGVVPEWPPATPLVRVEDANDAEAVEALQAAAADVVVVLGTAILRGEALEVARKHLLNVHGGIVPQYRNVHSEVWAVLRDDVNNVGVSVLHLDSGIDSGAVAHQRRLEVKAGESFFSLRHRNQELAVEAALEALELAESGDLPARPQDSAESGFFRTPGIGALVSLWTKTRKGIG